MEVKTKIVSQNEQFEVIMPCNPTTGYQWHESLDKTKLILIEKRFHPSSNRVGAGGEQILVFRAMSRGETSITLQYKRPWESEPIDEDTIAVKIT